MLSEQKSMKYIKNSAEISFNPGILFLALKTLSFGRCSVSLRKHLLYPRYA